MGVIIDFTIPPRVESHRYRNTEYRLTYLRDTKLWRWEVQIVVGMCINCESMSYIDAMREAKSMIDRALAKR